MLVFETQFIYAMTVLLEQITITSEAEEYSHAGGYSHVPANTTEGKAFSDLIELGNSYNQQLTGLIANIKPKLDTFDQAILVPLIDVSNMIKNIRAVIQKRDNKLLDYDRHRSTYEKLEAKGYQHGGRSLPDEQAFQKYAVLYQDATNEYNRYNDMLKRDIRTLISYRDELTTIITHKTMRIQQEIYQSLYSLLVNALSQIHDIDPNSDVMVDFMRLWSIAQERLNQINICGNPVGGIKPKKNSKERVMSSLPFKSKKSYNPAPSYSANSSFTGAETSSNQKFENPSNPATQQPNQYSNVYDGNRGSKQEMGYGHPPPYQPPVLIPPQQPPELPKKKTEYAVALYDYSSATAGDLNFKANDVIEILERTDSQEDWWTGRLNGVVGVFPSNYVSFQ
ncbi:hypothetical protein BB560_003024 [Smittium megazygosporum]|uniref:SH3 domain-containing protein n=1 Tax=Smittium megazygosporum TaxID=133381 RepID=A0A2T9ZD42_9FUNG|nr:hypothetical protein BB560_003024 [Smittium megazygosporum]